MSVFDSARHTSIGIYEDFRIDELSVLLRKGDSEISRLVWDAAKRGGASAMVARYSPNQTHAANQAHSTLAVVLPENAWLPAKDGSLRQPRTMPNQVRAIEACPTTAVSGRDGLRYVTGKERSSLASRMLTAHNLISA